MGPGGEGGGVHEVRRRHLFILRAETGGERPLAQEGGGECCPLGGRLTVLNPSEGNSGQPLGDGWRRRSSFGPERREEDSEVRS